MKVLMITGDKNFKPGNSRYELQRGVVERLEVVAVLRGGLMESLRQLWSLRREPFDVVTAQDPFWRGHLAWHVAWLKRAKLNLQVHTDLSALSWLRRWWAGINLRKADSVRVVSEKIKEQVEQMRVRAPIFVLPIYVDVGRFRSVQHKLHEQKTILWLGRFEEEKDPLQAMTVLEEVRKAGVDAGLIMLGSGSLEGELKSSARGLPVEFPGWQGPAPFLAMADVVLSTSPFESYGASIIEALAAGVPVVALDVGIAREAGAIVVPREQLAEAVVDVLKKGTRGTLRLELPTADEWARRWKETLL